MLHLRMDGTERSQIQWQITGFPVESCHSPLEVAALQGQSRDRGQDDFNPIELP